MEQCPKCKHKYAKYPIKDEQGNLIVKNLFKTDLMSVLFVIVIIVLLVGYNADTKRCHEIVESGCGFCEDNNCCKILNIKEGSYDLETEDEFKAFDFEQAVD